MKTRQTLFAQSDWRAIAGLCIPSLLSIVVMLLYNMADMYFVGWMGKVSAVAAVSLAGAGDPLPMAGAPLLGHGARPRIAQAPGRGGHGAGARPPGPRATRRAAPGPPSRCSASLYPRGGKGQPAPGGEAGSRAGWGPP